MTRRLARIALVAALMVGVVAMHSSTHPGPSEPDEAGVVAVHHHMGHGAEGHRAVPMRGSESGGLHADTRHGSDDEGDALGALSMLGLVLCGGILLRVAFEVLRQVWPRLAASITGLPVSPEFRAPSTRFRHPPPLLEPTSLLLSRIALLRI
ncbi:hypothetical protein K3N28_18595 [Glycomyces sp. TRM65418]|uniref:hypothetical protein n=1 Tax=Glycomyces sp. TRM65418 TaxID=2867006 RepID=UPI001CE4D69F|nr:hypothetical protein [Glycomyces sp. TRM65418]MCC3765072.1 hypothetical protein [Glycomyces sp. TRM65418]QZD54701.1 hypothetical protein K3N28_18505 [Glycomyces sp. TRM65418]